MTRHESARVIEDGLSRELAERIADWIVLEEQNDDGAPTRKRSRKSWVVGVYGARGGGKTSLLLTLLDELRQRDDQLLALPTADNRSRNSFESNAPRPCAGLVRSRTGDGDPTANLLKPAVLRDGEELVFEVLRHLEATFAHGHFLDGRDPFACARAIEVQRNDTKTFLEYEKEVGASDEEIRRGTVEIRSNVASSTVNLRQAFGAAIDELRDDGHTLVIFVDDLDLHPERALELLEIFHIFLDQPGVVIIVAADKPLLLAGIEMGLERRGLKAQRELAAALLAKYVPYEWHIPIPTEDERLQLLWPEGVPNPPDRELWRWCPADEQIMARSFRAPDGDARTFDSARDMANELMASGLPATYRGLYGFENRLRYVADELGCNPDVVNAANGSAFAHVSLQHPQRFEPLGLDRVLLPAFLAGALAFDVAYPGHLLWDRIRLAPGEIYRWLERPGRARPEDGEEPSQTPTDEMTAIWTRLVPGFQGLSVDEQRDVAKALGKLAELWRLLRASEPARGNFLPISLSADAMALAEARWQGSYREQQVHDWHIDLQQSIASSNHATRDELIAARTAAETLLRERSYSGAVTVFLKANLPFAAWLGWQLRYLHEIQVLNERSGVFTSFAGPGHQLAFENAGRLELLDETRRESNGPSDVAVLLIDVLGHSTLDQLHEFRDVHDDDVEFGQGVHLLAHLAGGMVPEQAERILRDCVEVLGQLQQQGITHVHLGLSMPDTLAFLLGQQLHARVPRISLYEYRRTLGRYEYIFDLEANE